MKLSRSRGIALQRPLQNGSIRRAYETLVAGCMFMAAHADEPAINTRWGARAHARLLGNRLRELDRFLAILLDEVAAERISCPHGQKALTRIRNTARKLGEVDGLTRSTPRQADEMRLRAIGRIAAVFHHCDGTVHDLTIDHAIRVAHGKPLPSVAPLERGTRLHLPPATILEISSFYRETGARLVRSRGEAGDRFRALP